MLSKLQKSDKDTNELIDMAKAYLFSVGVRTSRERAWDILKNMHQLPYKLLVARNKQIEYQGQGVHISHKHGDQLLVVRNIGRFELKGVSSRKTKEKTATIKFTPSEEIKKEVQKIKVIK